jgi:CBS domain-containing protein
LDSGRSRNLLVVRPDGSLSGVLTDAAIHRHGFWLDHHFVPYERDRGLLARELTVPVDVVVGPDEPLQSVVSRLRGTRQEVVVVVEQDVPVGEVTEHQLLQMAAVVIPTRRKVEDLPSRPVVTADRLEPTAAALHAMIRHRIRHLLVTEKDGEVIGVVSYRDLLGTDRTQRSTPVGHVCTRILELARLDSTLADCARRMVALEKGCLPVLCEGKPVRMVTRRDLIEAAAAELEGAPQPG